MDRKALRFIGIVAAAVGGYAVLVFNLPAEGFSLEASRAAALTIVAIAFWATGTLPIGVTAIAYLLLAMLLAVQPAEVVFSGFQSGAFWLVFAGMIVAVAVRSSGLGARIAQRLTTRIGASYRAILGTVAVAATTLNFIMPSGMGRILVLVPIVLAMADRYGFTADRPGRSGMIMVATAVSFAPSGAVMTALLPNLVMVGAAENLYEIKFSYATYLLAHFPVMGALRALSIVMISAIMFRDTPEPVVNTTAPDAMSLQEVRLAVILGLTLVLWLTDSAHGIAPAWIGLSAAVILLIPALQLSPANTLSNNLDYNSVFYTAGVLGMGAVISGSGLASQLGSWLTVALPIVPDADGANFFVLSLLAFALGPLITNPAIPAVLSPLAAAFAGLSKLPVDMVLMTQVAGFSNVIFPYQASPVIIGMTLGGVSLRAGTRLFLVLTLVTLIILLPLQYAWWKTLGLFAG